MSVKTQRPSATLRTSDALRSTSSSESFHLSSRKLRSSTTASSDSSEEIFSSKIENPEAAPVLQPIHSELQVESLSYYFDFGNFEIAPQHETIDQMISLPYTDFNPLLAM